MQDLCHKIGLDTGATRVYCSNEMTSKDFVYWLQGFAELHKDPPSEEQWQAIKNHLNLVFKHEIDPSMPDPDGKLQDAHDEVYRC
jgi:hypothetical protein